MKLDIVICLHKNNLESFHLVIKQLYKYLKDIKINVIANKDLEEKLIKECPKINFIDEDKIVPNLTLKKIQEIIKKKVGNSNRAGWYFQQFLKMGYSLLENCDEYYLIWDSDLILLKEEKFFENKKMILYKKTEYHKPYFDTLKKILNLDKSFDFSFICEHMIIKKEIMNEIITNIEKMGGEQYFEVILDSIEKSEIERSGFSEFETYGTYALKNYYELFVIKEVCSWRDAGKILKGVSITEKLLEKLGEYYDNFSLETWSKPYKYNHLIENKFLVKCLGIKKISYLIKKINKIIGEEI